MVLCKWSKHFACRHGNKIHIVHNNLNYNVAVCCICGAVDAADADVVQQISGFALMEF